jgi:glycerophosphoryl diester phosphodiesterase
MQTPEIIAHRGFSAIAPENTLAALRAALDAGAQAVEFDLQTAACGTPVLFHDEMLGRTTNGVGPLKRRPLGQLKALDAGGWFGPEFAGESIPTLKEALDLLRGGVGSVYQDIKGYREMDDLDRMVEVTRGAGLDDATTFLSSDWVVLDRCRSVAPEIRRGFVVGDPARVADALDRAAGDDGSLLDLEVGLVLENPEIVQEALAAGVEVGVWTVDTTAEARAAMDLGVTRLTTNQLRVLLEDLGRTP